VEYLYSGGNWNVNYTYSPVRFQPPNGTVNTELVTPITGHGTLSPRTTITHTDHPDDRFFIVGLNVRLNGQGVTRMVVASSATLCTRLW
jgi:hypothetical protein